ncbi:MAG: FHA domain-containing protein [Deltaproteobacteria bacterium]|nr:FHA domain-containing protein [Deltaproteobacteria bacterium]
MDETLFFGNAFWPDYIGLQRTPLDQGLVIIIDLRLHFRLGQRDMAWFVSNLSDNGAWINGHELSLGEERALSAGDELKLSAQCHLIVTL